LLDDHDHATARQAALQGPLPGEPDAVQHGQLRQVHRPRREVRGLRGLSMRRAMLGAMAACLTWAGAADAKTITVTSFADDGPGSIRASLQVAETGDVVDIPPGGYTVSSANLLVYDGISITGHPGTIIDGSGLPGSGEPERVALLLVYGGETINNA